MQVTKGKHKFIIFCFLFFLLSAANVVAQQLQVTGFIKDVSGEPIIGASVIEKGTANGVITDLNGNFSLSVNANASLVISYVGYISEEIKAETGKSIQIILREDTKTLDEVVVIGFGTQKKVNLTGAVGVATAKEIESRPVSNAVQALQGVVPGLKITTNTGSLDANMSIAVRGTGTVGRDASGNSFSKDDPLILIDGMEGDLNTLNPQDIESISILKDAASSAIYGSRAPFGVILVTTKSGKAGKTAVNYNNSFRFSSPLNLPETMDSYSWAVWTNQGQINAGGNAFYTNEVMQKMLDYQAGKLTDGIDPDVNNPNNWADPWSQGYGQNNLYRDTYKSSVLSQEHNLSVSGGTERLTYYASTNYLKQSGSLKIGDDGIKRYNVSGKVNAQLYEWLSFDFSTRYTHNEQWNPRTYFNYNYYGRQNWPNIPFYDPNGNLFHDASRQVAEGGTRTTVGDRNYYQAAFIFEPIKNWVTKAEINYSLFNQNVKTVTLPVYGYNTSGEKYTGTQNSGLSENALKEKYLNLNVYSEYAHTFADAHNFKVMLGFQSEEMKQHYFYVSKLGLMVEGMPEFDLTTGLNGSGVPIAPTVNGYSNEWATAGFFGRLNYDYKGRYLFETNLRNDGSSRFRRDNRWVLSPSVSLGWNIAQEDFWEAAVNTVNHLKLRFSYGHLSNQTTSAWYPTYRTMTLGALNGNWLNLDGTRPNTAEVGRLISTTLGWETVRSWNVGLDYGLFNNRLSGSFDYFTRYTDNMVGPAPELPATLGVATPITNNTDLYTRGWELSIAWRDRRTFGLNYGVNFSLSDQDTYIDKYSGNPTNSIGANANTGNFISGQKIGLIWGYETIGIAKTQEEMDAHLASLPNGGQSELGSDWRAGDIMYKDVDGDGKISAGSRTLNDHGDLKILGDANPHYFIGLDLTADWKGIDFRCFLQGVLKHDFWPGGDAASNNEGAGGYFWGIRGNRTIWHARGFKQYEDYFRDEPIGLEGHELPVNLDAYFPRPIFERGGKNQLVQTRYMQNARYIRLKNLQLGYTLPSAWTQKAGIAKCRVFFSGENLITFTPLFDVFDPETAMGGIGGNAYPLSRTLSFGLSLTL